MFATLISLLLTPAFADDSLHGELALQTGWQHAPDDRYAMFSGDDSLPVWGLRGAWRFNPNVSLLVDWGHGGATQENNLDIGSWQSQFRANSLGVGLRVDGHLSKHLSPYFNLMADGILAQVRLDDDPNHDDNSTQIRAHGLGIGGYSALGLAVPFGDAHSSVRMTPYLEMGYGLSSNINIGDLGAVRFYGFSGRAGVALRF